MRFSVGDLAQLIGACVLLFNCWQTWNNARRARGISKNVEDIKIQTNGLNEKLLKVTGDAKFAEGLKQGEDRPRP